MTDTTGLPFHTPCVAYGKSKDKTLTAELTEGTSALTFNNAASAIVVDDQVFGSAAADTGIQYLGACRTTAAGGITTQYNSQETIAIGGKVWAATVGLPFQWQMGPGGFRVNVDTGTALVLSKGNSAYSIQSRDPSTILRVPFPQVEPGDWELFNTVIQTGRVDGTLPFSFAYWHTTKKKSLCQQVRYDPDGHGFVQLDQVMVSFTAVFFVEADDTYRLT